MNIRDIQLLYKIKAWLGRGIIIIHKDNNDQPKSRTYRIRNKSHLKNIILPIFDQYPILSMKKYDYLRFRDCLLSGIIMSVNLRPYVRPREVVSFDESNSMLSLSYFSAWLVGFIEAEGCFSIYTRTNHFSKIASFDIAQTGAMNVITAVKIKLGLKQKVIVDKTNCSKLKVSSVRSIENVTHFMQNAPFKLQGYKKLQYLLWLKKLRRITRYSSKFNIPQKY